MILHRRRPARGVISLVPMIDVMMILLVLFMVTSTYLNLDMIPVVRTSDGSTNPAPQPAASLFLRIAADGSVALRGQRLSPDNLAQILQRAADREPTIRLLVLPSGAAPLQSLVSVMDLATQSGIRDLRIVRLDGAS